MAKSNREKIKLVSTAETGHYYTTTKNKKLHPEKMEVRKYDPEGAQACCLQRRQNQIGRSVLLTRQKNPPHGGFFYTPVSRCSGCCHGRLWQIFTQACREILQ